MTSRISICSRMKQGVRSSLPGDYATTANPPILHRKERVAGSREQSTSPPAPLPKRARGVRCPADAPGRKARPACGNGPDWHAIRLGSATGRGRVRTARGIGWCGEKESAVRKMVERKMNIFLSPIFLCTLIRRIGIREFPSYKNLAPGHCASPGIVFRVQVPHAGLRCWSFFSIARDAAVIDSPPRAVHRSSRGI